jgi:ceramide glucosyltransferase
MVSPQLAPVVANLVTVVFRAARVGLLLASVGSLAYVALALSRIWRFGRRPPPPRVAGAPVTVFKPLCGDEPFLYENLRSFCDQDYPRFEVVFGVRDPGDPAVAVAERVMREFPNVETRLVVDHRVHGANYKASNLANMSGAAKHDLFVIADSDMRVGRGYLASVTAPLGDPAVGVVTCLYVGTPAPGIWSALGAMFINEWFIPSVLVAHVRRAAPSCFGSTMALRREVLDGVGGFRALADHLADDYVLGRLVAARELRIVLSRYVVETVVAEPSLGSLWRHELRWARTIRSVRPLGHALSFVTYAVPLALLNLWASPTGPVGGALLAAAVGLRLGIHAATRRALGASAGAAWLTPIRDVLCLGVWGASLFGQTVRWRGRELTVGPGGRLEHGGNPSQPAMS